MHLIDRRRQPTTPCPLGPLPEHRTHFLISKRTTGPAGHHFDDSALHSLDGKPDGLSRRAVERWRLHPPFCCPLPPSARLPRSSRATSLDGGKVVQYPLPTPTRCPVAGCSHVSGNQQQTAIRQSAAASAVRLPPRPRHLRHCVALCGVTLPRKVTVLRQGSSAGPCRSARHPAGPRHWYRWNQTGTSGTRVPLLPQVVRIASCPDESPFW